MFNNIAVGRRSWLFCWTEVGAKYVGIIQSLLRTCRLQDIDPYTYLVDVLQRIETHPAREVDLLTPRLWKQHFAANPATIPHQQAARIGSLGPPVTLNLAGDLGTVEA